MVESQLTATEQEQTTTTKVGASHTGSVEGQVKTAEAGTGESNGEAGTTATEATTEKQPDNPILPTGPELVWGAVCFTLLWALMKFVLLKPIQSTMATRADKMRGDTDAAERAKEQGEAALAEYEASLAGARAEASRIIDDARAQAEAKRKEVLAAAEAEVGELRTAAAAEVAEAKAAALAELRSSVAAIAVQAAGAVIQKPLDADAQRAIVDEYLSRVSPN